MNYFIKLNEEGVLAVPQPELAAFQFLALASGGLRALMVTGDTIKKHRDNWVNSAVEVFLNGYRNPSYVGKTKRSRTARAKAAKSF